MWWVIGVGRYGREAVRGPRDEGGSEDKVGGCVYDGEGRIYLFDLGVRGG